MTTRPLARRFYDRPVLEVARDLLGCTLRHGDCAGVIVETEAYHDTEPACHGFGGVRPSTEVLFGEPGSAYVYRSYGIHALVNAVCEPAGVGAAVLIRAIEPTDGLTLIASRRAGRSPREWTSGPGKLTEALGISLDLNGTSLSRGPITIEQGSVPDSDVRTGTRIGITKAVDLPWRFAVAGSPHVSRPRL